MALLQQVRDIAWMVQLLLLKLQKELSELWCGLFIRLIYKFLVKRATYVLQPVLCITLNITIDLCFATYLRKACGYLETLYCKDALKIWEPKLSQYLPNLWLDEPNLNCGEDVVIEQDKAGATTLLRVDQHISSWRAFLWPKLFFLQMEYADRCYIRIYVS